MSEKEFELYLSLLGRFLQLKPGQRNEIADELRDQLEVRLEELSKSGLSREDAVHTALAEFGDAAELAHHFAQLAQIRKRRFVMRCTLATVVGLAGVILVTTAFWPASQSVPAPSAAMAQEKREFNQLDKSMMEGIPVDSSDNEQDRIVEAKLDKQLENRNYDSVPLAEVLSAIGESAGVDILMNEKELTEAGVSPDDPVTFDLKHTKVSAATQLRMMLDKLQLAYHIRDGIVIVERPQMKTRIYNCRDLLRMYSQGVGVTQNSIEPTPQAAVSDPKASGTGIVTSNADTQSKKSSSESAPAERLIKILTDYSDGDWEASVGEGGSIVEYHGLLFVTNDEKGHRGVQRMLAVLRELGDKDDASAKAP